MKTRTIALTMALCFLAAAVCLASDGKFYPLTGDPNNDERSYKKIDARSLEGTSKKAGKVTSNTRIVVAADGKSRTVTSSGTNSKGQKVTTVTAYDKE